LDIGCGEGRFSLAASSIVGDCGQVVAIDKHKASINILKKIIAQENIGNVLAFTGDATKRIPVNDNAIDVCLMVNVLHGFVLNKEVAHTSRAALEFPHSHACHPLYK